MVIKIYTNTEVIDDTIPTYHKSHSLKSYNEALLKSTRLTMKENFRIFRNLNLS